MNENELKYRRWIEEVWNNGNEEVIEELFDEDGVVNYPYLVKNDKPIRGIHQIKKIIRTLREKFSKLKIEISDISIEIDKLVVFCKIEVFHKTSVSDSFTENSLELKSLCQIKFKNGKIAEIWSNISCGNEQFVSLEL